MIRALRASAWVLLLACSAQAGIMQNEVSAPPPPNAAVEEQAAEGYIQNEAPDGLTEAVLGMFESMLALL